MKRQHITNMGTVCRIPYCTENTRINRVIQYIERNYSEFLELASAAEAAGVNPAYLSRLFHSIMAQSFTDYCTAFRLNKAAFLLETTKDSISDISDSCGFHSPSYFIKAFKDVTEKTPQEYRRALENNRAGIV